MIVSKIGDHKGMTVPLNVPQKREIMADGK